MKKISAFLSKAIGFIYVFFLYHSRKNAKENRVCCPTPIWFLQGVPAIIKLLNSANVCNDVSFKKVFLSRKIIAAVNKRFSTSQHILAILKGSSARGSSRYSRLGNWFASIFWGAPMLS